MGIFGDKKIGSMYKDYTNKLSSANQPSFEKPEAMKLLDNLAEQKNKQNNMAMPKPQTPVQTPVQTPKAPVQTPIQTPKAPQEQEQDNFVKGAEKGFNKVGVNTQEGGSEPVSPKQKVKVKTSEDWAKEINSINDPDSRRNVVLDYVLDSYSPRDFIERVKSMVEFSENPEIDYPNLLQDMKKMSKNDPNYKDGYFTLTTGINDREKNDKPSIFRLSYDKLLDAVDSLYENDNED